MQKAAVEKEVARVVETEHSYRPALKLLVKSLGTGVVAVHEPKRSQCGAPG